MTETATATRTEGAPTGPGWFDAPSASMPGHIWTVRFQNRDLLWCGCPRFHRDQVCRHSEAVLVAFVAECEAHRTRVRNDPALLAESRQRLHAIAEMFNE